MRQNEPLPNMKAASSLRVSMLFFLEIIQLLMEETNRYYHQYLDMLDEGYAPLPDVTVGNTLVLLYYCAD
jgi:hypothetical protein